MIPTKKYVDKEVFTLRANGMMGCGICRSEGMPYRKPANRYFTMTTGSMGVRPTFQL